jgi:hypothetical protein
MSMQATYRIQDEPHPSTLGHLVVNPLFPLLACMMAGPWLSLPWFVLNGVALGSATRRKELVLALLQPLVTLVLLFLLGALLKLGVLTQASAPYAFVALTVWKLAAAYFLYNWQQHGFALHEYYGGTVRNGLPVVLLGAFVGTRLVVRLLGENKLLVALLMVG